MPYDKGVSGQSASFYPCSRGRSKDSNGSKIRPPKTKATPRLPALTICLAKPSHVHHTPLNTCPLLVHVSTMRLQQSLQYFVAFQLLVWESWGSACLFTAVMFEDVNAVSHCCDKKDVCLDNGYCSTQGYYSNRIVRGGCTNTI